MSLPKGIGLYEDELLAKPITQLYLGKLDSGEMKRSKFYIRNESMGDLEEISLVVIPAKERPLQLRLLTPKFINTLQKDEVYVGEVEWTSEKDLKAGPYYAKVFIRGKLTRE